MITANWNYEVGNYRFDSSGRWMNLTNQRWKVMLSDSKLQKLLKTYPEIGRYLRTAPKKFWPILLPDEITDYADFAAALAVQRRNEEERTYVMNLQRKYKLPLRPCDSVKRTMIMARIKHLKKRGRFQFRRKSGYRGNLPIDPLE